MARELTISTAGHQVDALYLRPRGARVVYLCAHGAGAGMRHRFLETICDRLATRKVATFRFQFPYMQAGRKAPNRAPLLESCVRDAAAAARKLARGLPLVAGGKSMGGRISSQAQAADPIRGVAGIAFLGFPLHAPGKVGVERAAHLADVAVPMQFIQGTRDSLADLGRMRAVCRKLRGTATLHVVNGGDHSFAVLKRSGRSSDEVLDEIASSIAAWTAEIEKVAA